MSHQGCCMCLIPSLIYLKFVFKKIAFCNFALQCFWKFSGTKYLGISLIVCNNNCDSVFFVWHLIHSFECLF